MLILRTSHVQVAIHLARNEEIPAIRRFYGRYLRGRCGRLEYTAVRAALCAKPPGSLRYAEKAFSNFTEKDCSPTRYRYTAE